MHARAKAVPAASEEKLRQDALERRLRFTRAVGARGSAALLRLLKGTGSAEAALALSLSAAARLAAEDERVLAPLLAPLPKKDVEAQARLLEKSAARLVL